MSRPAVAGFDVSHPHNQEWETSSDSLDKRGLHCLTPTTPGVPLASSAAPSVSHVRLKAVP